MNRANDREGTDSGRSTGIAARLRNTLTTRLEARRHAREQELVAEREHALLYGFAPIRRPFAQIQAARREARLNADRTNIARGVRYAEAQAAAYHARMENTESVAGADTSPNTNGSGLGNMSSANTSILGNTSSTNISTDFGITSSVSTSRVENRDTSSPANPALPRRRNTNNETSTPTRAGAANRSVSTPTRPRPANRSTTPLLSDIQHVNISTPRTGHSSRAHSPLPPFLDDESQIRTPTRILFPPLHAASPVGRSTTPNQNAFAIRAEQEHTHRIRTNAFAAAQAADDNAAAFAAQYGRGSPSAIHPALRGTPVLNEEGLEILTSAVYVRPVRSQSRQQGVQQQGQNVVRETSSRQQEVRQQKQPVVPERISSRQQEVRQQEQLVASERSQSRQQEKQPRERTTLTGRPPSRQQHEQAQEQPLLTGRPQSRQQREQTSEQASEQKEGITTAEASTYTSSTNAQATQAQEQENEQNRRSAQAHQDTAPVQQRNAQTRAERRAERRQDRIQTSRAPRRRVHWGQIRWRRLSPYPSPQPSPSLNSDISNQEAASPSNSSSSPRPTSRLQRLRNAILGAPRRPVPGDDLRAERRRYTGHRGPAHTGLVVQPRPGPLRQVLERAHLMPRARARVGRIVPPAVTPCSVLRSPSNNAGACSDGSVVRTGSTQPPAPPAKDTPPSVRAQRDQAIIAAGNGEETPSVIRARHNALVLEAAVRAANASEQGVIPIRLAMSTMMGL